MISMLMRVLKKAFLDNAKGHVASGNFSGQLYGPNCSVFLFTSPSAFNDNMALADFTQPTDTGLAAVAGVTWGSSFRNQGQGYQMTGQAIPFTLASSSAPASVRGYGIMDNTQTPMVPLYAELFDAPVNLVTAGDGFVLVPGVQIPNGLAIGAGSVDD